MLYDKGWLRIYSTPELIIAWGTNSPVITELMIAWGINSPVITELMIAWDTNSPVITELMGYYLFSYIIDISVDFEPHFYRYPIFTNNHVKI